MEEPSPRPSLAAHLLVWLAVPAGEWFVARGLHPAPAAWQWAAEVAAFALLGAGQWMFAPSAWLRSLLWPPLFVVLTGLAVGGPSAPLSWQVFYVAGVVLLTSALMQDLGAKIRLPVIVSFALAVAAPIANRSLDLDTLASQISGGFGGIDGSSGELAFELAGAKATAATAGPGGPPIVVISIDTLRADAAPAMKSWQRLQKKGAWWPVAESSSSWTMPACASMQTGKTVPEHGADCIVDAGCQGIFPSVPTLAEGLAARGYRTAAVTANPWITRATGFSRGFQTFEDLAGVPPFRLTLAGPPAGPPRQDSIVVVDEAIAWLNAQQDVQLNGQSSLPIYLWVHLLGPHMPYSHSDNPRLRNITGDELRAGGVTGPEFRAQVRKAYDDEVAYTDREVQRLLDAIEAKGILDSGVVVLTADHGEEFWEHGGIEHGHTLHREVSEVPLLVVAPGVAPGPREGVASLIDIAPTLEAIAGVTGVTGVDLRKPLPLERIATSFGNLYGGTMRSARDVAEKVMGGPRGIDGEVWERYDLARDAGELSPLAVDPSSRVCQAAKAIEGPAVGKSAGVNRDALKALGYTN